jgi:type I restriction enzyme S subunit
MSWKTSKIMDVIYSPISGEWGDEGNAVNVIRTTNFNNDGSLNLVEVVTRNIPISKIEKKQLFNGDTILEKSGGSPNQPVGRVVFFKINDTSKKYLCNNFTAILRPHKTVDQKYFFWFLFYNHVSKKTLKYQNKTTGILNLKTERYLNELQIPLPPLPTQQKIAAILDKADELRRKDKALLAHYDELLQSIFYKMFGDPVKNEKAWEIVQLESVCSDIVDCPHSTPEKSNEKTLFACIRTSELDNGAIYWNSMQYVNQNEYDKRIGRLRPDQGDIVYGREGSFGDAVIIPDYPNFCLGQRTMLFRPNYTKCNSIFLWAMVRSDFVYRQALRKNSGSTVGHVNVKDIKQFKIVLPPLELQNEFSLIVNNINSQKQLQSQHVEYSENLFQSLLQKAFKGELVQ